MPSLAMEHQASAPPAADSGRSDRAGNLGMRLPHGVVERTLNELRRRHVIPGATYRLQFLASFGFREAAAIVPYLSRLGISHVYASPLLRAKAGSAHGYDLCDHANLNPELGDERAWRAFCAALAEHDLGLIIDIVPNHMSTDATNAWWNDVLENGPSSTFARFFDIEWRPAAPELSDKVLFPILARQFGDALESGEIAVGYRAGAFFATYAGRDIPLEPRSTRVLLVEALTQLRKGDAIEPEALAEFESVLAALDHLPPPTDVSPEAVAERRREKEVIKRRLAALSESQPAVASSIAYAIRIINGSPGDAASFDALEALLAEQNYRLCYWRVAADDINYRRFFDVNDLVAMCAERPEVFHATHGLIFQLLAEGTVSGLRIDHVDGLFAPEQYLWRLQWGYIAAVSQRVCRDGEAGHLDWLKVGPALLNELCNRCNLPLPNDDDLRAIFGDNVDLAECCGAQPQGASMVVPEFLPLPVYVEKILGPDEPLPDSWPVAGTTGYDFTRICDRLFVPAAGWRQIVKSYARLSGQSSDFEALKRDAKRLILRVSMASELQMLARQLNRISEQRRESRDFTLNMQRYALREVLACFPVYRVYPGASAVSARDRQFVSQAIAMAKASNPAINGDVFDFIQTVLLLDHPAGVIDAQRAEREQFAGRFQQVTSPVMAKGVEDTALYVYCPLASLDEVGGGPDAPPVDAGAFHDDNCRRLKRWPHAMLASTTHDSKRNEDVRARIDTLAEDPQGWFAAVRAWMRLNRGKRTLVDGKMAPSANDEYLFYQSLFGVWPLRDPDSAELASLKTRLGDYMRKATLEAKTHTSWLNPNEAYDRALQDFIAAALADGRKNRFLNHFREWASRHAVPGVWNGLSQVVLKLTSVGVPDLYQGEEVWNPRLVDPDNRVTPDYVERAHLLEEAQAMCRSAAGRRDLIAALAADPLDPRAKLFVTTTLLQLRARLADRFSQLDYVPMNAVGPRSEHLIAYSRALASGSGESMIVLAPRFWTGLLGNDASGRRWSRELAETVWHETLLDGPVHEAVFVDVFTGRQIAWRSQMRVAELLSDFPVAVLVHGL